MQEELKKRGRPPGKPNRPKVANVLLEDLLKVLKPEAVVPVDIDFARLFCLEKTDSPRISSNTSNSTAVENTNLSEKVEVKVFDFGKDDI